MFRTAVFIALLGCSSLISAAFPASYSLGYGFHTHGGLGPHGHYLPAVARVKVHKDPFQSHYALDEEGPTHYKYVRHSSSTDGGAFIHHPAPILHHHHGHHHHGHHHHAAIPLEVGVPATAAVPVAAGVGVVGLGDVAAPVAPYVGLGLGGQYYGGYGGFAHGGYY